MAEFVVGLQRGLSAGLGIVTPEHAELVISAFHDFVGPSSIDPYLPKMEELRSLDPRTNALAWQAAFPRLWSSAQQLLSILLAGTEHAHDREDIAARATTELVRSLIEKNLPSFNQISTFDDLLEMNRQIVRSRTKDFFRQRGRRPEDLAAEPPDSAANSPEADPAAGGADFGAPAADEATPAERTELEAAAGPLPGDVLNKLDETRREALSFRQVTEAVAGGVRNVAPFQRPKETKGDFSVWLVLAACLLAFAGVAVVFLPVKNGSKDIAVFAPRGATGFTQPRLVWDAQPGQKYSVWILPAAGDINVPALYIAHDVLPPVAFADLKPGPALKGQPAPKDLEPGQEYRLLVCLAGAGRLAGTAYSFHTAPDAATAAPPTGLDAAQKLAAGGRFADALAALAELPAEQRERPEARDLEAQLRAQVLSSPPP